MIYPDTVRCLGNSKGDLMRVDLKRKQYSDAKGRRAGCLHPQDGGACLERVLYSGR